NGSTRATVADSIQSGCALAARSLFLEHALQGQARAFPPKFDFSSGEPNLVTAAIILATIDAKFIPLHTPRASALAAHGVACQRAVGCKPVGPMHFVGNFHSAKPGPYLRTAKLLESLRSFEAHSKCKDANN